MVGVGGTAQMMLAGRGAVSGEYVCSVYASCAEVSLVSPAGSGVLRNRNSKTKRPAGGCTQDRTGSQKLHPGDEWMRRGGAKRRLRLQSNLGSTRAISGVCGKCVAVSTSAHWIGPCVHPNARARTSSTIVL